MNNSESVFKNRTNCSDDLVTDCDYSEQLITNFTFSAQFVVSPLSKHILVCVHLVVFLIALLGNVMICYAFYGKYIKRTRTNLFILIISITDLLQVIFEPVFVINSIVLYYWSFPFFLCPLVLYVQSCAITVRAILLVVMSIDKYCAILRFKRNCHIQKVIFWISIAATIIVAAILMLPVAVYTRVVTLAAISHERHCMEIWNDSFSQYVYSIFKVIVQYFLPLLVMIISYTHISCILFHHRTPGEPNEKRDTSILKSKKKTVKMLIAIVLGYTITWSPIHVMTMAGLLDYEIYGHDYIHTLWLVFHWLRSCSCCINSFIYYWSNKHYQICVKSLICRVVCARKAGVSLYYEASDRKRSFIELKNIKNNS